MLSERSPGSHHRRSGESPQDAHSQHSATAPPGAKFGLAFDHSSRVEAPVEADEGCR